MAYLKDISAVLGLSISAVSKALNGYPDISEETRKKVLKTAEELDYRYGNEKKQKEAHERGGAIGVVVPESANLMRSSYYRNMLCGMEIEAAGSSRDLVVMGTDLGEKQMSWIGRAAARNVSGVCLLSSREDLYEGRFAELFRSNIPIVSIGNEVTGYTSICSDFREDTRTAMRYLKSKGHRIMAYLGDFSLESRRCASILKEEAEMLDMDCLEVYLGMPASNGGLYSLKDRASCVIFGSFSEASVMISKWETGGLKIPEDISVIVLETGHDERPGVGITCVSHSPEELGREAVRRLVGILEHPESDIGERVLIRGEIIEGNTVKDLTSAEEKICEETLGVNSTRNY